MVFPECLQASYGGAAMGSSKEGYQETVASPTLPKQEVHVSQLFLLDTQ
jgi:hypothetical protein